MMHTFDPFQANVSIFAGRSKLIVALEREAINRRCVLLFGGRQSGKTTLLLRFMSLCSDLSASKTLIPSLALFILTLPDFL